MRHPEPHILQRLVDGELRRRKAEKVSAHLEQCSECATAVERMRATGDLLRLGLDEVMDEAPLEGFADRVLDQLERDRPAPWSERVSIWVGELFRHRPKVWAPPMALASAAAVALLVALTFNGEAPSRQVAPGSSVISVSFGNSVEGTVFEVEDKDGSTTAVIWVDQSKSEPDESDPDDQNPRGAHSWATIGTKTT